MALFSLSFRQIILSFRAVQQKKALKTAFWGLLLWLYEASAPYASVWYYCKEDKKHIVNVISSASLRHKRSVFLTCNFHVIIHEFPFTEVSEALLPLRGKGQENSINACLPRVSLFPIYPSCHPSCPLLPAPCSWETEEVQTSDSWIPLSYFVPFLSSRYCVGVMPNVFLKARVKLGVSL